MAKLETNNWEAAYLAICIVRFSISWKNAMKLFPKRNCVSAVVSKYNCYSGVQLFGHNTRKPTAHFVFFRVFFQRLHPNVCCFRTGVSKLFCPRATQANKKYVEGRTFYVDLMWLFRICYILTNRKILRENMCSFFQHYFFHHWQNGFAGRMKWLRGPHLARGP